MNLVQRIASVNERTLDRLIRAGIAAVVVGIVAASVIFYFDRHPAAGPSLLDRQMTAAESAVRKAPSNTGLRLQLAETYRAANKPDKALAQYDAVLKVDASNRAALLGRGDIIAAKGNFADAATMYRKVIGKARAGEFSGADPQLESAYYGLGSVALKQNQAKVAVAALQNATKVDPTDSDAQYLLGVAELKIGQPKTAVKALRQAILFVPTGWCEPYQQLSAAYTALKNKSLAEYAGAMVDYCQKRPADAQRRLKTLTTGPAAVDAMLGLGIIAETQSDRATAISWYRKVLAADPSNTTAQTGLGRVTSAPGTGAHSTPPGHPSTNGTG
jgi:tetratricopeptide (TPR) repeat protein